jgi:CRISPR/Cas system-associated endoribonuclease Cas2
MEALEHYHIRKIEAVIQKFITEERDLIRHVILREAGIPDKYYHDYDDYIQLKIQNI